VGERSLAAGGAGADRAGLRGGTDNKAVATELPHLTHGRGRGAGCRLRNRDTVLR
jgi:hypothetical protein